MTHYYKRFWEESTGEAHTDAWGSSTYFFETDITGNVLRQVEVYANGRILKYDSQNMEDGYGRLADQALDLEDFNQFKIDQQEFEKVWRG